MKEQNGTDEDETVTDIRLQNFRTKLLKLLDHKKLTNTEKFIIR